MLILLLLISKLVPFHLTCLQRCRLSDFLGAITTDILDILIEDDSDARIFSLETSSGCYASTSAGNPVISVKRHQVLRTSLHIVRKRVEHER